ncbi:MAG: hypothetical protein EOP49_16030 [Sphingobacteriales bacterium]|nr:MAG: hypothetical protein EOP49_16030 [Sphingobacteriales bacterium]
MAKQKGIVKIKGTVGDLTFYKSGDGYIVKEKSEIPRSKLLNDPAFIRTRENMSEFARAGKASKVLRNAVRTLLLAAKDNKVVSRLTKAMTEVIKADATSLRGLRNVIDGETELLRNFDFNIGAPFTAKMYAPYAVVIDRAAGTMTVDLPAFNAARNIVPPDGATHCKIVSAGADIDFTNEVSQSGVFESPFLPLVETLTAPINITHTLTQLLLVPILRRTALFGTTLRPLYLNPAGSSPRSVLNEASHCSARKPETS